MSMTFSNAAGANAPAAGLQAANAVSSTRVKSRSSLAEVSRGSAFDRRGSFAGKSSERVGQSVGFGYLKQVVLTSLPLVLADILAVTCAVLATSGAVQLVAGGQVGPRVWVLDGALIVALLAVNLCFGLYPGVGLTSFIELRQTSLATSMVFLISLLAAGVHQSPVTTLTVVVLSWIWALALVPWFRSMTRATCQHFSWWGHPTLIFGGGQVAEEMYRGMARRQYQGLKPVGIVDRLHAQWNDELIEDSLYLGASREAADIARKHRAYWAVVVMPDRSRYEINRVLGDHAADFPHLLITTDTPCPATLWTQIYECGGSVCVHLKRRLLLPLPRIAKRSLDLSVSLLGGLCASPIILALIVAVKFSSPGPIFYSQERIGRGGRKFRAWKFRSMVANADEVLRTYLAAHPELQAEWDRDHKLKNDPRITAIGKIIRKTSLDELPQVWNVIRGDMSLVGPRPIVQAEIAKYRDVYAHYSRVTPGISGLWQVSGRNNTTYDQRLEYDEYYVDNWSPWMDLYILGRTVKTVLFREGAY